FKNNWSYNGGVTRENERISMSELRGGPSMKLPGDVNFNAGFDSDSRRGLAGGLGGGATYYDDDAGGASNIWTYLAWRPNNAMRLQVNPEYSLFHPELQYMETTDYSGNDAFVF